MKEIGERLALALVLDVRVLEELEQVGVLLQQFAQAEQFLLDAADDAFGLGHLEEGAGVSGIDGIVRHGVSRFSGTLYFAEVLDQVLDELAMGRLVDFLLDDLRGDLHGETGHGVLQLLDAFFLLALNFFLRALHDRRGFVLAFSTTSLRTCSPI